MKICRAVAFCGITMRFCIMPGVSDVEIKVGEWPSEVEVVDEPSRRCPEKDYSPADLKWIVSHGPGGR